MAWSGIVEDFVFSVNTDKLADSTEYFYRVTAENTGGTFVTPVFSGTTSAGTPKASTLMADFTTNTGLFVLNNDANIANGTLNIPISTAYTSVITNSTYDLTSSQIHVELAERPVGPTSETFFAFEVTSQNRVSLVATADGTAVCRVTTDGVNSDTYPPLSDGRFFRFREDAGTLYFEKSPDCLDWSVIRSVTSPPWVNNGKVLLMAGYYDGQQTVTGTARYDNINLLPSVAQEQGHGQLVGFPM